MRRERLFLLWLFVAFAMIVKAEAYNDASAIGKDSTVQVKKPKVAVGQCAFVVKDITVNNGQAVKLPVAMNNKANITAFQCDIIIADGVAVKTNNGKCDIQLASNRSVDHKVISGLRPDGTIRLLVASFTNKVFAGSQGDLFYLNLQSIGGFKGKVPVKVKNIHLSEPNGTRHDLKDVTCVIECK